MKTIVMLVAVAGFVASAAALSSGGERLDDQGAMAATTTGAPEVGGGWTPAGHDHSVSQFGQSNCPYCGSVGHRSGSCQWVNGRNWCTYTCVSGHRWQAAD